jgi:DNA-binding YbaB/EbfC family protein
MSHDFGKLMRDAQKSMQKMQQDMAQMQAELAKTTIEGTAGGGAVVVQCTGAGEFTSVKIKPEAVDPSDVETLEDLVLAAVKDASNKSQQLMADRTNKITSGMNLPPGLMGGF